MISFLINKLLKVKTAMLCTAVLLTSCAGDRQHSAIVEVSGVDKNYPVYLMKMDTGFIRAIDSVMKPTDNAIRFKFSLGNTGIYIIQNKVTKAEFIAVPNDTINLNLINNNVTGGTDSLNLKFGQYIKTINTIERQADSLASLFVSAQPTDSFPLVREKAAASFEMLLHNANSVAKSYISHNPSSIGIFRVMNSVVKQSPVFNYNIDYEWFYSTDSLLQKYHHGHPYSIWLHNKIEYFRKTFGDVTLTGRLLNEGFDMPKIALPGTNHKLLKIDPMRNGITLLYLWDPSIKSRKSNARVKLINEKYQDRNFRLYTIAFYSDYERWSSVIILDKLWGKNMIDTVVQKSVVMEQLNNPPLPSFILIDQNNKVVAHFGNELQLEEWLNRYFKRNETNKQVN